MCSWMVYFGKEEEKQGKINNPYSCGPWQHLEKRIWKKWSTNVSWLFIKEDGIIVLISDELFGHNTKNARIKNLFWREVVHGNQAF